ncbi:endonuclease/exonuclease/phosphatase family protein [Bacillus salinus]|uniref:hypothetical protein n=1 Tax=Bacillus sp. HMF5848 TaxID=2495421 RepID=UPI00163A4313|nr:hypothetical protein [Bacillus sp. HMF5848]
MKIISWNCQRGHKINEKLNKIDSLKPDIAVIQECPHPNIILNANFKDYVWLGKKED